MNKTLIIILLSILLVLALTVILWPNESGDSEIKVLNQRDSLQVLYNRIERRSELTEVKLKAKEAELSQQRDKVKRSEQRLNELLKRERYAQIENKRLIQAYTNYQLDSAFMAMYPVPDDVSDIHVGDIK